eukprot:2975335-Alexandrium_andersonii.AAC.1
MSASLVGSEMCIRDSASGIWSLSCAAPRWLETGGGPPAAPLQTGRGAVSYTHLTLPTICSV